MPRRRSKIFIDADAFVALATSSDTSHKKALGLSKIIKSKNIAGLTSNFAVGEAITVISQRAGLGKAVAFGLDIYQGEIHIIDVNRDQQLKALKRFSQQKSKNIRFTDFVNMVLMDELKIKTIFSFDKHYKKANYQLLGD